MELIAGETMRQRSSRGALEARELARLGAQTAEALAAAHARGVVHGDVKPENLVVTEEGRVKVLDFGIARVRAEENVTATQSISGAELPRAEKISGTLAYLAPEVLRGEPSDARTDLYSLGVTLYELAAGHRPFAAPLSSALIAQILREPAPPLLQSAKDIPAELARIVHKLLEKNPESRYQSARDVQVDLNNLQRDLDLGPVAPAVSSDRRAVAVLPFALLTPNPEDEYLGVALADAVIHQLSASGQILVRPTSMVRRYAGKPVDPLLAARELNVQVIMEGSIQRIGTRLRVHVQAWNAADGTTFLSSKHDGDMTELFELQDAIATGMRELFDFQGAMSSRLDKLQEVLTSEEERSSSPAARGRREKPAERPTKNPQAYELYLRAQERFARLNRWDTRTAIEMLETATQLDPKFAEAWARMAEMRVQMALHFDPGVHWIRQAERDIRRALSLNSRVSEAQCARGKVLWTAFRRFQNREALRALNKALELDHRNTEALRYRSIIQFHLGLLEEARKGLEVVLSANPDDDWSLLSSGHSALYAGDLDGAERHFHRALTHNPSNLLVLVLHPVLSIYAHQLDTAEQRIRAGEKQVPGDSMLLASEALLWAKRGEERRADRALRAALKSRKGILHAHHTHHYAAAAATLLGRKSEALALLKRAAKHGLPNYPLFRDDPHFRPLHGYAPFENLLKELKKEYDAFRREFGEKTEHT
jgi:serine/threonine-protein kinase